MSDGVTIGQAARFVGVTVKTIRHYHRLGAVPEPARDLSGYRRYSSSDLLRLIQARTLAEAGVAIREIDPLLRNADTELDGVIDRVERDLSERITELQRRRERLQRLRGGPRALLPASAAMLLDRMDELGFEPDCVEAHQEAFVLALALVPEGFDVLMAQTASRLDDPEAVDLMKRSWQATSWEPDDPRLPELASLVAANLLDNPGHLGALDDAITRPAHDVAERVKLVSHHRGEELPTSVVLTQLIEERLRDAADPRAR